MKLIPQKNLYRFVHDDLRVMPISFDGSGNRRITFAEAVSQMDDTEPVGGRGVSGAATAMWVVREIRDHSLSPTAHHEHWFRRARIPDGDRSVYEHEVLCKILEAMACQDQLNVLSLTAGELLVRRMQLIKEAHRIAPSAPDYSAADQFMGWGPRAHGAAVAPELAAFVAKELKAEAEISKEARKAREENSARAAGRGRGRGKGGRSGLEAAGDS